jgi:hypothetical protein
MKQQRQAESAAHHRRTRHGARFRTYAGRWRYVDRGATFYFDAGKAVYELVDPQGTAYVMQALCIGVDPTMSEASLLTLGERLHMPDGWTYRTRILHEELVIDTTIAQQRFTTDCEVCCRPFEVFAECEPGEILSLEVQA